jgi:hypothetical protein
MAITLTVVLHEDKINGEVRVICPCGCEVHSNDLPYAIHMAVGIELAHRADNETNKALHKASSTAH